MQRKSPTCCQWDLVFRALPHSLSRYLLSYRKNATQSERATSSCAVLRWPWLLTPTALHIAGQRWGFGRPRPSSLHLAKEHEEPQVPSESVPQEVLRSPLSLW
jgi:hypothetical protein